MHSSQMKSLLNKLKPVVSIIQSKNDNFLNRQSVNSYSMLQMLTPHENIKGLK